MTLTPLWRGRFFAAGAAALSVWLSFELAQGQFFWPAMAATALGLFLVARFQPLPIGTLFLGGIIVGYILGNRGFAQLFLLPTLPILPAEAVLAFGGTLLLVQSAWRHQLPFRREPLNLAILVWMLLGTARIGVDVRAYGFLAVRDFAVVYYAAFFFLGQEAARDPKGARFLEKTVRVSCAALLPAYAIYDRFQNFFLGTLTFRGNPLIFYKGDLVGTFLAVGAVLFFLRYESHRRWWQITLSLMLAAGALLSGSRAAMLGLFAAAAWLAAGRRWRFAAWQLAGGIGAAVAIFLGASALRISWEKTPLFGIYERVQSMTDPTGVRQYRGVESASKGDNNVFRIVWWQSVVAETVEGNPYLGLGFGHDLANRFVQEYLPEGAEEFSARSPHNVLLTVFARMGGAGLAAFLSILAIMGRHTLKAVQAGPDAAAPWCGAWVILTSACFGVVLEGPMGAVVFWTILGVAHGSSHSASGPPALAPAAPGALATTSAIPDPAPLVRSVDSS